jgi:hypothetical protein
MWVLELQPYQQLHRISCHDMRLDRMIIASANL